MADLKTGLDPRAYNFIEIDSCQAPLWRSHNCKQHGYGYEDIVGCMETTYNVTRMLQPCCMEPYNDAARQRLAYWKVARFSASGQEEMGETDRASAEMLRNISTSM